MANVIFFIIAFVIMLVLLLGGVWIAFAIGIGGILSLYPLIKKATLLMFGVMSWDNSTNFILLAVPLFVFMGEFLSMTGVMAKLYSGTSKIIRGVPGGLVQTNIFSCTIFAACSGSSVASAATMGRVAFPEQVQRLGYDDRIVLGSIAAGGTLGILIPPSIFFIIYGSLADQSVGALYLGGVVPGLIMSLMFMIYIGIRNYIQPELFGEKLETISWKTRFSGLKDIWPFFILIITVMGSIYGGIATPTEAAGMGGGMSILIVILWRSFTWKALIETCFNTVKTTCMIFLILINAKVVSVALGYYGIPSVMKAFAQSFGNPIALLTMITIIYLILGTVFEDFSLMLLVLPFVLPLVQAAGFNLVWYGVFMCMMLQAGLLSPPVGLNLFVMQGVTGAPLNRVVWGSLPFFFIMLFMGILITWYPRLVLWLPGL